MGNKYLVVICEYYSNSILICPIKARSDSEFNRFFKDLHEHLLARGVNPAYMRLYTEYPPPAFQRELNSKDINLQLQPPGMYRRNAAECVISTFKDHFILGICSIDPDFPMQNWYRLLEQAYITLNLLLP